MKKIFIMNKNIVHLIDDIFWNMGFKTETQADKVMPIIRVIFIISIISLIQIIRIICRFMCGRTRCGHLESV